ncbi:MAG TPA: poly-gamma-glutamate synthase PgsB [Planctomycetaceae bacterium]|nr:poly-gamma-glutamate synthase PgsB [Planctomycetaceae bacterium]
MEGLLLLAGATGVLTALGSLESLLHRRRLGKTPIRVHVNGTRGKSSVTRLIAAGLRAGGLRTFAKTTGTLPRMILPDGTERPVHRITRPNIGEQVRMVAAAAALEADALVLECMAVQPLLQSVCELEIVRSTHGVITNARPDHLDVMGPGERDVARALAGTVPVRGTLFTAERDHLDVLADAARDRNSRLVAIGDDAVARVGAFEVGGFGYIEHPENIALALAVCRSLGVDRRTALGGMWKAAPDPGVMTIARVVARGRSIAFVNGFAANDPESTAANWKLALRLAPQARLRIAVVNCREDRADRSLQLAELCRGACAADRFLIVGTGTGVFLRRAQALGINPLRLRLLEGQSAPRIFEEIVAISDAPALVMGVGNIAGIGMELTRCFHERSAGFDSLTLQEAA